MAETFKVEVKDPPQGIAPPHPGGNGSKKSGHEKGSNRLRKFVAKPSAGLRIRIHPTLQSEQVLCLNCFSFKEKYHYYSSSVFLFYEYNPKFFWLKRNSNLLIQ